MPQFCIIDNAHVIDKDSLRLVLSLARLIDERRCHCMLVLTARPVTENMQAEEPPMMPQRGRKYSKSRIARSRAPHRTTSCGEVFPAKNETASRNEVPISSIDRNVSSRRHKRHFKSRAQQIDSLSQFSFDLTSNDEALQQLILEIDTVNVNVTPKRKIRRLSQSYLLR